MEDKIPTYKKGLKNDYIFNLMGDFGFKQISQKAEDLSRWKR